jgi:fluoride exporter
MTLLLLALAGGLGAVCRFLLDGLIARHNRLRIPLGTLTVNVTGSLLLGLLAGWLAHRRGEEAAGIIQAVVGTGFCGGYTTFSTAAVETVRLWMAEGATRGAGYAAVTLLTSTTAAAVGLWLGSLA